VVLIFIVDTLLLASVITHQKYLFIQHSLQSLLIHVILNNLRFDFMKRSSFGSIL